jgi:hypothetical protein
MVKTELIRICDYQGNVVNRRTQAYRYAVTKYIPGVTPVTGAAVTIQSKIKIVGHIRTDVFARPPAKLRLRPEYLQ